MRQSRRDSSILITILGMINPHTNSGQIYRFRLFLPGNTGAAQAHTSLDKARN